MRRRQQGMTLIGMLFVLGLVGVIVYAGIRLAPLYLNYMKVARSLSATAEEAKGENPDPATIKHLLARHWQIESIDTVEEKDVEVTKGEARVYVCKGDSGAEIGRAFCADCGTPLWAVLAGAPFTPVKLGALDDNANLLPSVHIYAASAPPWHLKHEGAAVFDKFPPGGFQRIFLPLPAAADHFDRPAADAVVEFLGQIHAAIVVER